MRSALRVLSRPWIRNGTAQEREALSLGGHAVLPPEGRRFGQGTQSIELRNSTACMPI
jgi:hypothetical protein